MESDPRTASYHRKAVQSLNILCEHGRTQPHITDDGRQLCIPGLRQAFEEDNMSKEPAALQDAPPEVRKALDLAEKQLRRTPNVEVWRYQSAYHLLQWELLKILAVPRVEGDKRVPAPDILAALTKAAAELT